MFDTIIWRPGALPGTVGVCVRARVCVWEYVRVFVCGSTCMALSVRAR